MAEPLYPWQTPSPKPLQTSERRAAVRFASLLEASCQSLASGDDTVCQARVWDISVTGISLVLEEHHPPGTLLTIFLEKAPHQFSAPVDVRVVHVSEHMDDLWFLGCEFLTPLAPDELEALL